MSKLQLVTDEAAQKKPLKETASAANTKRIIRAAIEYSQAVGAYFGAHDVDPDGDCRNAVATTTATGEILSKSIQILTNIPAVSAYALQAKARLVPIVSKFDNGHYDEDSAAFYKSFAADVRKYLEEAVADEWCASRGFEKKSV